MDSRLWQIANAVLLKPGIPCAVKVLVAGVYIEEFKQKNIGDSVDLSYARIGRLISVKDNERIKQVLTQAVQMGFFERLRRPSHVGNYKCDIPLDALAERFAVRQKPQCPVRQKPQCPVRQKPHTLISNSFQEENRPQGRNSRRGEHIGSLRSKETKEEFLPAAPETTQGKELAGLPADQMTDEQRTQYVHGLRKLKKQIKP